MKIKKLFFLTIFFFAFTALHQASGEENNKTYKNISLPEPGFELFYGPENLNRPVRKQGSFYKGPIIDTHTHILNGLKHSSINKIFKDMEARPS